MQGELPGGEVPEQGEGAGMIVDLSDEGFQAALSSAVRGADLRAPGLTGAVAVVVPATAGRPRRARPGAPAAPPGTGSLQGTLDVEGGRIVGWRLGAAATDVVATLTLPVGDARAALAGREEPSVLFMQGRLKVDGDMAAVLAVLRATASSEYRHARATLAGSTGH